jgi:hypothetical protein
MTTKFLVIALAAVLSLCWGGTVFADDGSYNWTTWASGLTGQGDLAIVFPQADHNRLVVDDINSLTTFNVYFGSGADSVCSNQPFGRGPVNPCVVQWDSSVREDLVIHVAPVQTHSQDAPVLYNYTLMGRNTFTINGSGGGSMHDIPGGQSSHWADGSASSVFPTQGPNAWTWQRMIASLGEFFNNNLIHNFWVYVIALVVGTWFVAELINFTMDVRGAVKPASVSAEDAEQAAAKKGLAKSEIVKTKTIIDKNYLDADDNAERNKLRTIEKQRRDNTIGPLKYRGDYGDKSGGM